MEEKMEHKKWKSGHFILGPDMHRPASLQSSCPPICGEPASSEWFEKSFLPARKTHSYQRKSSHMPQPSATAYA